MPLRWNEETKQAEEYDPVAEAASAGAGTGKEASDLVSVPTELNIANAPNFEKLAAIVGNLNRKAQEASIPGGAELAQQSSQNIANLLSGQLPTSFTNQLQSSLAQQYAGRGFAPDTAAMNAAALRASGLQSMQLQSEGERQRLAALSAAPQVDTTQFMLTPALYGNYLNQKAQQAAEAASLAERQREFEENLTLSREQMQADSAMKLQLAQMQQGQAQRELDEKVREFNATRDTNVLLEIQRLRQAADQAGLAVQQKSQELNAQVWGTALQYMDPAFASAEAQFRQQLPQYVTTSAAPGSSIINIPKYPTPNIKMLGGY